MRCDGSHQAVLHTDDQQPSSLSVTILACCSNLPVYLLRLGAEASLAACSEEHALAIQAREHALSPRAPIFTRLPSRSTFEAEVATCLLPSTRGVCTSVHKRFASPPGTPHVSFRNKFSHPVQECVLRSVALTPIVSLSGVGVQQPVLT